ncbi:MAG: lipopolysaccharide core heptose(I) kinase RfaP [Gammaproteobacteria bacterium]|nr:lipopolysaccharide core heptose(I) kinase RfaP [Gammaproteobacteria bacterium]
MMILKLVNDIRKYFTKNQSLTDIELFYRIMSIQGEIYRKVERRETLKFFIQKKAYFIKKHFGTGWKAIFESLIRLRLPVISAENEYRAIHHLQSLHINAPEIVGFGKKGWNPASIQSFIMTIGIEHTQTLHDLVQKWQKKPPEFRLKLWLIQKIATIMKLMHESGMNHRDCYLVHFRVDESVHTNLPDKKPNIYVLDLHRAQIRKKTPSRWKIKDLAGLYFSSKDGGLLTQKDLFRFMKTYRGKTLRDILNQETKFWKNVQKKGEKLYQKEKSKEKQEQYLKKKNGHYFMFYNKAFESSFNEIFKLFTARHNHFSNQPNLLKDGDTSTVTKYHIGDQYFVMKRYNIKGFWHGLKRAFQKSRAQKSWENAHRLLFHGFLTPKPIAMIEKRFWIFKRESYFLMEYIEGTNFSELLLTKQAEKVKQCITDLHKLRITHGDTKATNFIISNDNVYIIDLDAMKKHNAKKRLARAIKKDLTRFARNGVKPRFTF